MTKVLYSGDISPCRILINATRINDWKKGEIKELSEREASKVVGDNKNFSYVDKQYKRPEEPKEEKPKEKMIFDLDGDGDVDSDDYSIAAKTLAHARKTKKNDV